MDDSNILQFNRFLKNSILYEDSSSNKILDLVRIFYSLRSKNEEFILNPKKKIRTIPDFEAIIKSDYDEESNPGEVIKTNLPLKFEETNNNLKLCIRDSRNIKNIIEIDIILRSDNLPNPEITNIKKELLLYKINSVKNKKNILTGVSEKNIDVIELKEYWESLKNQVEQFTKDYSKFIEIKNIKESLLEDFHLNIIKNNNQRELINFENNLLIYSLINSNSGNDTDKIQYYIIINLLINQYNKSLSLISNKPIISNLIGSVVYDTSSEINKDNIFIVKERISDSLINVIDINGNISKVSIDSYSKIYDKLKTVHDYLVDPDFKTDVVKSSIRVTKNIIDKKIKLNHKGDIQYTENKTKKINNYNDISDDQVENDEPISQEVIESPEYKLVKTNQSLDSLILGDYEGTIYIYPNIFDRDVGEGYINSKHNEVFVKENCDDCNLNLNKISDWRNKLTKSYIITHSKNGEIIPIIIDKKLFSSVAHYYLYYSNKDNKEVADDFLYNKKRGNTVITHFDLESDIENEDWEKLRYETLKDLFHYDYQNQNYQNFLKFKGIN